MTEHPKTIEEIYTDLSNRSPLIIGTWTPHQVGQISSGMVFGLHDVTVDPPIRFMVLREATQAEYENVVGRESIDNCPYFYEISID